MMAASYGPRPREQTSGSPRANAWDRVNRAPQARAASDAYKVACRDRWINVTKTMMSERAEIITTNGCTYEGVFHLLTPVNVLPDGNRGLYQVRCFCVTSHHYQKLGEVGAWHGATLRLCSQCGAVPYRCGVTRRPWTWSKLPPAAVRGCVISAC